jgi:tRNA-dihydrouridine synthase B
MIEAQRNPLEGIDVVLAPLAGITDAVYRRICLEHGADMVVTEMVSADGLARYPERLRALRNLDTGTGPVAIQIFGSDPENMGRAAAELSALNPRFIDLNFGCPVRKIVSRNGGAALLKNRKLLGEICKAVVRRSSVPVSAKMRSGWDGSSETSLLDVGRTIEDSGVSVITLHARSRVQAFKGRSDWGMIRFLKENLSIAVIGNGDIRSAADYNRMREETGCDAAMIGRGAVGNPWIFAEIKAGLEGRPWTPPSMEERLRTMFDHVSEAVRNIGEPLGLITSRKTMAAYAKYLPSARKLRRDLMSCISLGELEGVLREYLDATAAEGVAAGVPRSVGRDFTACGEAGMESSSGG